MVDGNLCTELFLVFHILLPCKIPKIMLSAPSPYWDSSVVGGYIFIVSSASGARCQEVDLVPKLP